METVSDDLWAETSTGLAAPPVKAKHTALPFLSKTPEHEVTRVFLKFMLDLPSLSLWVILVFSKLEKILASLSSGLLAIDAEANLS